MQKLSNGESLDGHVEAIAVMEALRRAPFECMDPAREGRSTGGQIEVMEATQRQVTADDDIHNGRNWLPIMPMETPDGLSERVDGVLAA